MHGSVALDRPYRSRIWSVYWINLAQDWYKFRNVVTALMNLGFLKMWGILY
jgi:hypothetical protein